MDLNACKQAYSNRVECVWIGRRLVNSNLIGKQSRWWLERVFNDQSLGNVWNVTEIIK